MALSVEVLIRALGLVGSDDAEGSDLAEQIREPAGCCMCVVATRRELTPFSLPHDGSLPAVVVGPALRGEPPRGACPLVIVAHGTVLAAWAWPDARLEIMGVGRT